MTTIWHPPTPSRKNLAIGGWKCVGITQPCTWLYQANMGAAYLGLDSSGSEQWFGRDAIHLASRLWSWNDGFEHWMQVNASPNPQPTFRAPRAVVATPVASSIADSNHAKRSTDVARAMSSEETGVRAGVNIAHAIGSVALTAVGGAYGGPAGAQAGAAGAQGLGLAQQAILDAAYGKI